MRWYEFRIDKKRDVALYQQGTYAPDGFYRWMASPAMDRLRQHRHRLLVRRHAALRRPALRRAARRRSARRSSRLARRCSPRARRRRRTRCAGRTTRTTAVDPSDDCTIWYVGDYLKKGARRTRPGSARSRCPVAADRRADATHRPSRFSESGSSHDGRDGSCRQGGRRRRPTNPGGRVRRCRGLSDPSDPVLRCGRHRQVLEAKDSTRTPRSRFPSRCRS